MGRLRVDINTEELVRKLDIFCNEAQELTKKYPFAVIKFDEDKLTEFIGDNMDIGVLNWDATDECSDCGRLTSVRDELL